MLKKEDIQNKQIGKIYKPLYVSDYSTVKKSLESGDLKNESELILFQVGNEYLAFSEHLMTFHHIAEGY